MTNKTSSEDEWLEAAAPRRRRPRSYKVTTGKIDKAAADEWFAEAVPRREPEPVPPSPEEYLKSIEDEIPF